MSFFLSALDVEREDRRTAVGEVFCIQCVIGGLALGIGCGIGAVALVKLICKKVDKRKELKAELSELSEQSEQKEQLQ